MAKFNLSFTRGDTQFLRFKLLDSNGSELFLTEGDKLYLTVKRNYTDATAIFQKTSGNEIVYVDGYHNVTITSDDTSSLPYGKYVFDIQLNTANFVKTILFGTFSITEEVTHKINEV